MSKKNETGFWALIGKFGSKLLVVLPKLLKLTKLIKLGLLAISFASYAYLFSWKFAALILFAVGVHEQGHVYFMRRVGIKTKGWYALPLVGGVALASSSAKSYRDWSLVALGGPLFGFALALATYAGYLATGLPMLAAATSWIAMLNLFNLFLIAPLDGGHILKAISFSVSETKGFIAVCFVSALAIIALWHLHVMLFVFFGVIGLLSAILEHWMNTGRQKKLADALEEASDKFDRFNPFLQETFGGREEYLREREKKLRASIGVITHPILMTKKEVLITAFSYLATVFVLIGLMMATKNIPGADIASNFMADK
jgi:Zn-dependent protease